MSDTPVSVTMERDGEIAVVIVNNPPVNALSWHVRQGLQDHFTAGASWKASDSLEVTGYVMRAPRKDVRGSGSIPAPFGGGEADVHLGETAVGLALGITL